MRHPPAALFAAAFVLCAILLSSCSYLADDPYPDYTQRMLASADLDAMAKAASGGSPIQEIGAMSYLESSGSSALFVELRTKDGVHRLLALDGEGLDDPKSYKLSYSFTGIWPAALGDYVFFGTSGWVALKPGSRAVDAALTADLSSLSGYAALLSDAKYNYFFYVMANANLNIDKHDAVFAPVGTMPTWDIPIGPSVSLWDLIGAGQGKGYFCFLMQLTGTNQYRAFRTPSMAKMGSWTSIFDDPAVPDGYKGAKFSSDLGSLWITVDGPVVRINENDGATFTLKAFSGSDSDYTLKKESDASYSFEPTGRYWFLYDRKSGMLYKLRTWW